MFEDEVRDIAGVDPSAWRADFPEVHAERERELAADLAPCLDRFARRPNIQEAEFKRV